MPEMVLTALVVVLPTFGREPFWSSGCTALTPAYFGVKAPTQVSVVALKFAVIVIEVLIVALLVIHTEFVWPRWAPALIAVVSQPEPSACSDTLLQVLPALSVTEETVIGVAFGE